MPSPFPGMDPYIEGQLWEDFHHNFITDLQARLVPQVRPRYSVRVEQRVYIENVPDNQLRWIRPDVAIAQPVVGARAAKSAATLQPPFSIPLLMPEEVQEPYLELKLLDSGEVVTVVELLSPGNKRSGSDGRREYMTKRRRIISSETQLVELDFLRGGDRMPAAVPLPPGDYYALVRRGRGSVNAGLWPIALQDPLPTIPIPLAGSDPDVLLDLQSAFTSVYDRAGYDYSLQYHAPTVPPLDEDAAAWAARLLAERLD